MKVIFSTRAYISLLVEVNEKIKTETGGVFLGKFDEDTCFIVETIDPGPNSIFTPTYFEYDVPYVNHLINKQARIYERQLELIGLWHRHPGSLDTFSSVDDKTNSTYAKLSEHGAIAILVNVDPNIRLTVYHVKDPLEYEKIEYLVSDELIAPYLKFKDFERKTIIYETYTNLFGYKLSKGLLFHKKVRKSIKGDKECPVEILLEALAEDLETFEKHHIEYSIEIKNGCLYLSGNMSGIDPWDIYINLDDDIYFEYENKTYKYSKGLFTKIIEKRGLFSDWFKKKGK